MKGLLIGGFYHQVPDLEVMSPGPGSPAWLALDARDYRRRRTPWVRQIILHTTKGMHPQRVRPGAGAGNRDRVVAEFWRRDAMHSAAHIVIDNDGSVAVLADLASACAYHATTSNDWSVGIEIYQEIDGSIFEAALEAAVKLVPAICEAMSIPFQIAGDRYVPGKILDRMRLGGPDCVGIFGHRDQAWDFDRASSSRGRGDPGDEIYKRLVDAGAEPMSFAAGADLAAWKHRQARLNSWGERTVVDGICGPATIAAMRKLGFANGRAIDAAVKAPA